MTSPSSRVIVVGGGPTGLTAAHALSKAGIDFVLLESRSEVLTTAGASLVMNALGQRALGQLGLLPALNKVSTPLTKLWRIDDQGRDLGDAMYFTYFEQSHGFQARVLSRYDFLQVLWSNLSSEDQSKIHTGKKVEKISKTEDGVVINCTDGTSYDGSVVIGADGAYSIVRKHMRLLALEAKQEESKKATINEEHPYLTTYRCFWVRSPVLPGMKAGESGETHASGVTTQFFVSHDSCVVGAYEALEKPTRTPTRYTQEDEVAFAEKWGHLPVTEGGQVTLGQLYEKKMFSGFINLEEGVVSNWSFEGRMVLAGDAAHKFTPSTGTGCNNGIADIVVLANQLHKAFSAAGGAPSSEKLAGSFKEYQDARFKIVNDARLFSGSATAMSAWSNIVFKFLDLYVLGNKKVQKLLTMPDIRVTSRSPVFEYIEGEEQMNGSVPWAIPMPSKPSSVVA